ncbi:hypothetical protein BDW69DRAFT_198676 [Aspergillus filifer]
MNSSSDQCKLDNLPIELLEIIVSFIPGKASLKSLSSVSSLFRQLCTPILFKFLSSGFSTQGLNHLLEISNSQLARYVQVIYYEAPALVDPLAGDWDTFRACLYTPAEFAWDRRHLQTLQKDQEHSYPSIFSYFCFRCQEQQRILQANEDTKALLSFVDGIDDRFEWLANHMLLDGNSIFPNHLERLLAAISVVREHGVTIRLFEICGFNSRAASEDEYLQQLAVEALQDVEELRLVDSPALLPFLNRVLFPCLCRVELASCWLSLPALEEFLQLHAESLQFLHLADTWVLVEELNNEGIHLSAGSPKMILRQLVSILKHLAHLRELAYHRNPKISAYWRLNSRNMPPVG